MLSRILQFLVYGGLIFVVLLMSFRDLTNNTLAALLNQNSALSFNHFQHPDGLFEFDYLNNFQVIEYKDVYSVVDLVSGEPIFHVFENDDKVDFDSSEAVCTQSTNQEICYVGPSVSGAVDNFEAFLEPDPQRYQFMTRGDFVAMLLNKRYPQKDFSEFAADCFADVSADYPHSGEICRAAELGIVNGYADGLFYPDRKVNLWAAIKVLFLTYEVDIQNIDASLINHKQFERMTDYHSAYDLMLKAIYEGLFENPSQSDIWPNAVLYRYEYEDILENFNYYQSGGRLRIYGDLQFESIFADLKKYDLRGVFDLNEDSDYDYSEFEKYDAVVEGRELFYLKNGVKHFIAELPRSTNSEYAVYFDDQRLEGAVVETVFDQEKFVYRLQVKENAFIDNKQLNPVDLIGNDQLLPRSAVAPGDDLPKWNFYLNESDFVDLYHFRTRNDRYSMWLEHGDFAGPALIKTRGNGSRSNVKSSYTVEDFEGNEWKLRSLINDPTKVKEHIGYYILDELGFPAPKSEFVRVFVNEQDMGIYQLTEPIKKDFFESRGVSSDHYVDAQNIASESLANLLYNADLDNYVLYGEGTDVLLLDLMKAIRDADEEVMQGLDLQNIFDFALIAYAGDFPDSITANYYLYFDESWHMFFWDLDIAFGYLPELSMEAFLEFARLNDGRYNALVEHVFARLSEEELEVYLADFQQRFAQIDIESELKMLEENYLSWFVYDSEMWNGKYLERKDENFDTKLEFENLKSRLMQLKSGIANL